MVASIFMLLTKENQLVTMQSPMLCHVGQVLEGQANLLSNGLTMTHSHEWNSSRYTASWKQAKKFFSFNPFKADQILTIESRYNMSHVIIIVYYKPNKILWWLKKCFVVRHMIRHLFCLELWWKCVFNS